MTTLNPFPFRINRRRLLRHAGQALIATPFLGLAACGGDSGGNSGSDSTATATGSSGSGTTTTETSSGTDNTNWLSGGTSAMEADFPPATDPFDSGLGNLCSLTDEFTIGPCYFDVDDERDDISEGELGVPMTLALKLVDANCIAVEGAVIEVWWCNAEGIYSADNSDSDGNVSNFNSSFCSGNDSAALAAKWFRGIKTTDSDGNVYFKACFPGWYNGRTTHIHFRIVLNGNEELISQFGFDDDLANDIYLNHSDYTGQQKDTSNSRDNIFGSTSEDEYLFEVEEQWDGSMLAYKAIQIDRYV